MIKRVLMRIARAVLEQVIGQITQQVNVVEDQVKSRLQSYVQEVLSGVWTGNGADAFVATINDEALPRVQNIVDSVGGMHSGINNALQVMDEADQNVRSMVDGLADTFASI